MWTPVYDVDKLANKWGARGTPHERDFKSRSFGVSSFSAPAENSEGWRITLRDGRLKLPRFGYLRYPHLRISPANTHECAARSSRPD
jgi:hypothetical protein